MIRSLKTAMALKAAVAAILMIPTPRASAEVQFLTHSLGQATYLDDAGHIRGKPDGGRRAFYVELVHAMMADRGIAHPITQVPLSRGLAMLDHGGAYALFNIVRTEARNPKYKWVGPTSNFTTWFYEHADHPTAIKTLDDARAVSAVCAVRGNNMVSWYQRHGFQNVVIAGNHGDCIQLLAYGRVDLVHGSRYERITMDEALASKIHRTPVSTALAADASAWTTLGHIAFSKSVPDAEIKAWQDALDRLKASGAYEALQTMYLKEVNGQPLQYDGPAEHDLPEN